MLSIQEILESEFGLDLTGWVLGSAVDVSDDGTVIVGHGVNPSGDTEGWIAHIPSLPGTVIPTLSQGGLLLLTLALLSAACIVLARRQSQCVARD